MKKHVSIACMACLTLAISSCARDPYVNAAQTRGAVGGTAIGAIIGKNSSGIGMGEAMVAGALIGALMGENELHRSSGPRRY